MRFLLPTTALLLFSALACSGESMTNTDPTVVFDGGDGSTRGAYVTGGGNLGIAHDEAQNPALRASGVAQAGQPVGVYLPIDQVPAGATGISFRIRSNLPSVEIAALLHSTMSQAVGGGCQSACDIYHATTVDHTTSWQTVTLSFSDLVRPDSGAAGFSGDDLRYLAFIAHTEGEFDIWLDDIVFVSGGSIGGSGGGTATGGAAGTGGESSGGTSGSGGSSGGTGGNTSESENRLGKYVSQSMFLTKFGQHRNPLYVYSKLLEAVDMFPDFASCCSESEKKREVAAFMAQVQHEADYLKATNEYGFESANNNPSFTQGKSPEQYYCSTTAAAGCANGKSYHGRGALQLTWNYNYRFAQDYFATQGLTLDLWGNPELVGEDSDQGKLLLWTTALWFWMEGDPSYHNDSPHDRLKSGGFGSTTYKINGGLECGQFPANSTGAQQRANYYLEWTTLLDVDPGSPLTCENITQ